MQNYKSLGTCRKVCPLFCRLSLIFYRTPIIYNKSNGDEAKYENLNELFSTSRDVRNELFGSYLAEGEFDAVEVQKKVEGKIKTYETQVQNLKVLNGELKKLVTEQNVERIMKDVEDMNRDQAQALMEKLQAKFAQQ